MRGLTLQERTLLLDIAEPCGGGPPACTELTMTEQTTFYDLVEQGRAEATTCLCQPGCERDCFITPAGREALKLYALMQSFAEVSR